MRLRRIPPDTSALPTAVPLSLVGGKVGVLLLHGFTGTPRDLVNLAGRLHDNGLTVSVPRLPGHGTNGSDFLQSGWRDWLRASVDAYADLKARCEAVHLVGFSMGGIIAVLLAARFSVTRLVLLAPALRTRSRLLAFTPFVKLFIRRMRWPYVPKEGFDDPDLAVLAREYWQWRYSSQAASLLHLKRMSRRLLSRVTADTLTIVGDADGSVPVSVIQLIEGKISAARKRHLVIENGAHLILAGEEGGRVADEVVQWLVDSTS
jgi:carboxylesterase